MPANNIHPFSGCAVAAAVTCIPLHVRVAQAAENKIPLRYFLCSNAGIILIQPANKPNVSTKYIFSIFLLPKTDEETESERRLTIRSGKHRIGKEPYSSSLQSASGETNV